MEGNFVIPTVQIENGYQTLIVNNRPFLIRGGEVHNSNASSLEIMEQNVWPHIAELNINTLLVPIYWESIEPIEGNYCFELVEGIINQARKYDKKLVFLWFGLWKNAESMYVPNWMKKNTDTYFRAKTIFGEQLNTISPFCAQAIEKDAQAFSEVMNFIKGMDSSKNTVLMIQVENEVGLLGTDRDYGPKANQLFEAEVPQVLQNEFSCFGTWKEVFKENAEEYFSAYYFAQAIEEIASRGSKVYPLPMYANAWLEQHPWTAGTYPSGGPIRKLHKIWKKVAPTLFTLAPDIYVPYTKQVMEQYCYNENPLFIPEVRKDAVTASYCLNAFFEHHALGYSPFGIEDLGLSPEEVRKPTSEVMKALNINPLVFETEGGKEALSKTYKLIENLEPLYFKYRGTDSMKSFLKRNEWDLGQLLSFNSFQVLIDYFEVEPGVPLSSGVIFEVAENKFIIAGMMAKINFLVKQGEEKKVGQLSLEYGTIINGEWVGYKKANGDDQLQIYLGADPTCILIELYKY